MLARAAVGVLQLEADMEGRAGLLAAGGLLGEAIAGGTDCSGRVRCGAALSSGGRVLPRLELAGRWLKGSAGTGAAGAAGRVG